MDIQELKELPAERCAEELRPIVDEIIDKTSGSRANGGEYARRRHERPLRTSKKPKISKPS